MTRSVAYREVSGAIRAPASKSSMQRAVACALLAEGESTLRAPSRSADCLAALGVARALGAIVDDRREAIAIRGIGAAGLRGSLADPRSEPLCVSCGESGLCIRMFSPIAALFDHEIELCAEGTLEKRPVGMLEASLAELGAECRTASGFPPVVVRGPLLGGRAKVDGRTSSQFLTGLLVALPLAVSDSVLEVESLASRGYIDLTLDTMRAFGVDVERNSDFSLFRVPGSRRYRAADFTVEGDWSGAAFLLVAAAIAARGAAMEDALVVRGLNAGSSQPDRAILEALRLCGAVVEAGEDETRVARGRLEAFEFDATDCPDLFPPLVALAVACDGETRLGGAQRLRGKESDRAAVLCEEFGALGARIEVSGDLMSVRGVGLGKGGSLPGGRVDSRGDHRIAMAAATAALACAGAVEIVGAECVVKSWPDFFEDFGSIARH